LTKLRDHLSPEVIRAKTTAWFGQRIDLSGLIALAAKKTVPIHRHSWIYLLGGAALFLLGLQVVTGCLLMLYYQPSEATAYESIEKITSVVPYGWLVRGVHVWCANLFIVTVVLHFLTVLFARAYRKPRELTWLSGIVMLFLTLGLGFSGYLLPWNELSFAATRVGTDIPGTIPVVGDLVVHVLRGGEEVTGETITRFFAAHVMILPMAMGAFLLVHLALIQFQGMSVPLGTPKERISDHRPFVTEFALIDACVWLVLLGTAVTLAVFLPAELGAKADVLKPPPEGIQPEWYFLFMFKTLELMPKTLAIGLFALGALFFVAVPFLDRGASAEKRSPRFTAVFLALIVYAAVFEVWSAWPSIWAAITSGGATVGAEATDEQSFRISRSIVWLSIFWAVIGFMIFYLRQLLRANTHVRKLYRDVPPKK